MLFLLLKVVNKNLCSTTFCKSGTKNCFMEYTLSILYELCIIHKWLLIKCFIIY
nr:MAG TPA: hypothetical protein [Caudoviricetes sp.]